MKNDCIKREDAHDMVRLLTRYVNKEIHDQHGVNEMVDYDDVQSGLEKISAASAWISVKDRLPEQITHVIVTAINRNPVSYYMHIKGMPFVASAVYFRGSWFWWDCVIEDILSEYGRSPLNLVDAGIEITHWMPLPDPAKEDPHGT